jgi:uncharacterized protein YcbK (DUF882 family)
MNAATTPTHVALAPFFPKLMLPPVTNDRLSISPPHPDGITRRRFLGGLVALGGALLLPSPVLAAAPQRGERRLSFVHTHTGERFSTTYWGDGAYLERELGRVDDFLRDFRTGERHPIDPALLDQLHQLALATGTTAPFQVISGYRSPATNAALRAVRGGQASHSLHMRGQAIDVRLADVSSAFIRDAALDLRQGGVGFYPGEDFVHIDTGRVRHW